MKLILSKKFNDFFPHQSYPLFFTLLFTILLFQYPFHSVESIFYDFFIRADINQNVNEQIILININEESDQNLGENYPYTYTTQTHFFKKLIAGKPKLIGYLSRMEEPLLINHSIAAKKLKQVLNRYVNNGGIFRFGSNLDFWKEELPPPLFIDLGYSLSILNIDNSIFSKDDVIRRTILTNSNKPSFHLWMANQYRKQIGLSKINPSQIKGSYHIKEADADFALFRYYTNPTIKKTNLKNISYANVRTGNFPPGLFKDKMVFIGSTHLSNSDNFVLTPFSKQAYKTSKLNVHAVITQALIQKKTIVKIPKPIIYLLAIIILIFLSYFIPRVSPYKGLIAIISLIIGTGFSAYLLFIFFGLWLQITHLIFLTFMIYYIWIPFKAITEYQNRFAIQEESRLLKQVEDLKQNFMSLMSHDLKTPVSKIAGLADIMLAQNQFHNKAGKKNLEDIINSTKELNGFITNILDLVKVKSKNISLHLISRDINQTINKVISNLSYEATKNHITIKTELAPLYPIQYDPQLMERVISNIIVNAIKYSGQNSNIDIKTSDNAQWVLIEIKDNGVGIPEKDLAFIFEKFYRVQNNTNYQVKGSGLGLFLVDYFIKLHKGELNVESTLGKGTNFKIKLRNL